MSKPLSEFLRTIPKAELHSHIDGCIRPETIVSLAKKYGVALPSYDPVELYKMLYREKYENLDDLLKTFALALAVMKTPEALEQVAYEFVQDYLADGVFYVEGKIAPQQHVGYSIQTIEEVLVATNRGMKRAADEHNASEDVKNKLKPECRYGIISCIMRSTHRSLSPYYANMIDAFKYEGQKAAEIQAGIELVHASANARDKYNVPIAAIDLVGGEKTNPPEDFVAAFALARKYLFHVVIHAGEAEGPESMFGAISILCAQRIGHGLHLFNSDLVRRKDPEKFCLELAQYMAKKGIPIEICLSSNYKTAMDLKRMADHPVKKMIENGLTVCFCCDDKFQTNSELSHELELAITELGISLKTIKKAVLDAFEEGLAYVDMAKKAEYIESVKRYYETIEAKYPGLTQ